MRDRDSKRASKKPDKRLARLYRKMPVTAKGQATPLNEVKKRKRGKGRKISKKAKAEASASRWGSRRSAAM